MKKESPKKCGTLHIARETRKTLKRGKMKNKKYKKRLKCYSDYKIPYNYFLYIDKNIFCSKTYFGNLYFIVSENVLYTIRFLVNVFLVLQDI